LDANGISALSAKLDRIQSLALNENGGIYIGTGVPDTNVSSTAISSLYYVDISGLISRVAGVNGYDPGDFLNESYALDMAFGGVSSVTVMPDSTVLLTPKEQICCDSALLKLETLLPGFSGTDLFVRSGDASEVYRFSAGGVHLDTRDALTNQILRSFEYDSESRLVRMLVRDGRAVEIERTTDGKVNALNGPFGARVSLGIDDQGRLTSLFEPDGRSASMEYDPILNRLSRFTDRRGNTSSFIYYPISGKLAQETDPLGGTIELIRTRDDEGAWSQVEKVLQDGTNAIYRWEFLPEGIRETQTDSSGAVVTINSSPDGRRNTLLPDGTLISTSTRPSPDGGISAPLYSTVAQTPSGRSLVIAEDRSVERENDDPFGAILSTTDSRQIGSRTITKTIDIATRRSSLQLPSGYQLNRTYDDKWRLVQVEQPGLSPLVYAWALEDDLLRIEQDDQSLDFNYDTFGRLSSVQDALGHIKQYEYDDSDRRTRIVLPSSQAIALGYDADDNFNLLKMPSGAEHRLTYSHRDRLTSYTDPLGNTETFVYDSVGRRAGIEHPSGAVLTNVFDAGGRVDTVSYPGATVEHIYSGNTDILSSITRQSAQGSQQLAYSYDGFLEAGLTFSGSASGAFLYDYDADLRLTSIALDGGSPTVDSYDTDGRLSARGPFGFSRGTSGLVNGWSGAGMQVDIERDLLGRTVRRGHTIGGVEVYRLDMTYDAAGQILSRTEFLEGSTSEYTYAWDANGSLLSVDLAGAQIESYAYDVNGNRTSVNGNVQAFNAADQVTQVGDLQYVHDKDGYLTQRGSDQFNYSMRGELISATAGGQQIQYVYDGFMRRVARTVGGNTTQFLYGNPKAPFVLTHTRAPDGTLTTYLYDDSGLLIGFHRSGQTYHVITDQVGSPRLIVDEAGLILREITYSAWGEIIGDTAPGIDLAIGFAGGLADPATGLVRFGMRDYDPISGRWTARDPALFRGGPNLYMYASNNPISNRDPLGLYCTGGEAYAGLGGGVEVCYKDGEWSLCSELGFGAGAGLKVNPFGDVARTERFMKLELGVNYGVADAGFELKATDCGGGGKRPDLEVNAKCAVLLVACNKAEVSTDKPNNIGQTYKDLINDRRGKYGASAKLTLGACARF